MKTPDITPAQIGALIVGLGGQAVAYGWISSPREQLGVSIITGVLGVGWKLADAIIRNGRSRGAAARDLAEIANLFAVSTKAPPAA